MVCVNALYGTLAKNSSGWAVIVTLVFTHAVRRVFLVTLWSDSHYWQSKRRKIIHNIVWIMYKSFQMVCGQRPFRLWFHGILGKDNKSVIQWLMRIKLLADERSCSRCDLAMKLRERTTRNLDRIVWYVYWESEIFLWYVIICSHTQACSYLLFAHW